MKKSLIWCFSIAIISTSCVSKKKFIALQDNYDLSQNMLAKTNIEKEELENTLFKIKNRVNAYNQKISSLTDQNASLSLENNNKLDLLPGSMVLSKANKEKMRATLATIDPNVVAGAKTLKDSINLAVGKNLTDSFSNSEENNNGDIDINVEETVVKITVSDKLLFNTASYRVNSKAYPLLSKLAAVINSEPSMDVMVEGHTDSRTINNAVVQDNWDLSVKRATSIIRILQKKYGVNPEQLIASGRSSYFPIVENNSKENMAQNRRTRIVILPNLDKFFALMASN